MTKLNTYLPLEVIMKSKKLQKIDIKNTKDSDKEVFRNETEVTIADIIDNSEMLFGKEKSFYSGPENYISMQGDILYRCQKNNSIQDISNYIIKNIK